MLKYLPDIKQRHSLIRLVANIHFSCAKLACHLKAYNVNTHSAINQIYRIGLINCFRKVLFDYKLANAVVNL
jgi:hypothetical protein